MSTPAEGGSDKRALRGPLLQRRAGRSAAERAEAAAAVADALAAALRGAGTVAAFVPGELEPGHGTLPAALAGGAARVLLPVVPPGSRELDWAQDTGELTPGRFGLLEPAGPRLGPAAVGAADAIVVPALAVARNGARLGRGGGFYDRALRRARRDALVVAVVFDDELVDHLPTEPHDVQVTAVVTPSGGWWALPAGH